MRKDGYLAGASYRHVEKIAGRAGLGLLVLIVTGLVVSRLLRRYADRPRLRAAGDRLAATPPLAWLRRRYPRQVAWSQRRLEASDPRGFWLTFTVTAGALTAWAFGAITQDVVAVDETALRDPRVAMWAGPSFPSSLATIAAAGLGMLAIILATGRSHRTRALLWTATAAVTFLARASQVYLGASWLTDAPGGWALGATWIAILTAVFLVNGGGSRAKPEELARGGEQCHCRFRPPRFDY